MNIYTDRILPLLQSSNRTDRDLEAEIGLPRGILYKWKTGKNKSYEAYCGKIASYFNVSTDYLLGNTDIKAPSTFSITFDDFTVAMHNQSDRLTEEQKLQLLKMAELFAKDNERK